MTELETPLSNPLGNLQKYDLTVVISDLTSGGSQRVITTLVNALADRGYRISVITASPAEQDFFTLHERVMRKILPNKGNSQSLYGAISSNLSRIRGLRAQIRQIGAPVVLSFIAETNIQVILACLGLNVRTVISERNDPARQSLGKAWDFLRKRTYRFADVVTANSHGAIDSLRSFVPNTKLRYVPNPLLSRPELSVSRSKTILNVGRFHRQKAQDVLIKAFAKIATMHPDWFLALLGEGSLKQELLTLVEDAGLNEQVRWLDPTPNPSIHYDEASVFVLPSRHEGTPNALIEAMAAGLPAIVSDASSGPLEIVKPDIDSLVVPVEDVDALADAMELLVRDPEKCATMGENAKKAVARFDLQTVLSTWLDILTLPPPQDPTTRA
jgi:GalNAc-alpha-(1->4)-GalNAc-alpha-(1->3)-diNAcBac-PP-undecaprenol alpha-1,4-N-acetyl-D-galactosaminyltransferase